jgi:hypothetical protein
VEIENWGALSSMDAKWGVLDLSYLSSSSWMVEKWGAKDVSCLASCFPPTL